MSAARQDDKGNGKIRLAQFLRVADLLQVQVRQRGSVAPGGGVITLVAQVRSGAPESPWSDARDGVCVSVSVCVCVCVRVHVCARVYVRAVEGVMSCCQVQVSVSRDARALSTRRAVRAAHASGRGALQLPRPNAARARMSPSRSVISAVWFDRAVLLLLFASAVEVPASAFDLIDVIDVI